MQTSQSMKSSRSSQDNFNIASMITQEHLNQLRPSSQDMIEERRRRNGYDIGGEAIPVAGNNMLSRAFFNATKYGVIGGLAAAPVGIAIALGSMALDMSGVLSHMPTMDIALGGIGLAIGGMGVSMASLALAGMACLVDRFGAEDTNTVKQSFLERKFEELKAKDEAYNHANPTPDDVLLKRSIYEINNPKKPQSSDSSHSSSGANTAAIAAVGLMSMSAMSR